MAVVELAGDFRRRLGKGGSRGVRRDGFVPAILYGSDEAPTPIKVDAHVFETLVRTPGGVHSVIEFKLPGADEIMALIREVQRDPITRDIVHVDFQRIKAGVPVTVRLPIALTGTPEGVKLGGILEFISREIDVKVLPRHVVGRFEVDVSELNVGDSLQVKDLDVPNMEILSEPERTIAVVVAPTVVAEPTTEEEEAAEGEGAEAAEGEGEKDEKDEKSEGEG
jgi:large subunit ribosomal protein L25